MLSIVLTVLALTLTACPDTAWTARRFLRVLSEVRNTSARGGRGGGVGVGLCDLLERGDVCRFVFPWSGVVKLNEE